MKNTNKAMLITYPNRLGNNLHELNQILENKFMNVFGAIHILPFYPSSGDDGFAPITYDQVDDQFGSWTDIESLGKKYQLMADLMINHLSPQSPEFKDFVQNHKNSKYADLFLSFDKFWPKDRPTQQDIDLIYKRKNRAPYLETTFADGSKEKMWNTFSEQQLDLDVRTATTMKFIKDTMAAFKSHGINTIRLDAFAYAVKKLDTNDFFVEPEIWDLLSKLQAFANDNGQSLLPEIHEDYKIVHKLTDHNYFTYDFALPIVTLYSLYSGQAVRLVDWINKSPMTQYTTLDTHDGIGVVDGKDILTDDELTYTSEELYKVGANVKKSYSTSEYHNLDVYQINTTYYSALGDRDQDYLLARAIQIFAPGIPQIYYVGLLAGKNDLELLEKTKEGRSINRHYYDANEIDEQLKRPVVQSLLALLRFRNSSAAFDLDGSCVAKQIDEHRFSITRSDHSGDTQATLTVDLETKAFNIAVTNDGQSEILDLNNGGELNAAR